MYKWWKATGDSGNFLKLGFWYTWAVSLHQGSLGALNVIIRVLQWSDVCVIFFLQSKDHQEHCHCEHRADSRAVEAEV